MYFITTIANAATAGYAVPTINLQVALATKAVISTDQTSDYDADRKAAGREVCLTTAPIAGCFEIFSADFEPLAAVEAVVCTCHHSRSNRASPKTVIVGYRELSKQRTVTEVRVQSATSAGDKKGQRHG